eukprot:TRINITY_DN2306_c0_g1_i1.p1 TRINITY_DN2306_c0_g1~~TRINITY_DN2306_c0_g1_i1.p1  ORF type:complete len:112 (+),score=11.79 TRINITY_DN2306_c0_g1_i1:29-337(+)
MADPLSVRVNVTKAYTDQLPLGWRSSTTLPSQTVPDRSAFPPQESSPMIGNQTRFTSWTIVNKSNWDSLAYQWLYGGQYPRVAAESEIKLSFSGLHFNPAPF